MELLLFYGFATLAIAFSVMVISAKNPIHSVFYLVLVFLNAAGLFILLGAEFFSIIFIIVYVGAIAILFLFIVMMLDIKLVELNENMLRYIPLGAFVAILFFFEVFLLLDSGLTTLNQWTLNSTLTSWDATFYSFSNLEILGFTLFTSHFFLVWIASFILLVAMIGAIVLTVHSDRVPHLLVQSVFKQSSSHFSKSTILKA